jgi:maltodextrin utilization protein YvdJ
MFSDMPAEYMTATDTDIEDFHNFREELAQMIIDRDRDKYSNQKNYIVTHTFVDFREVIIGEKLRAIQKSRKKLDLRFDNLYYADWMQKCGDSNIKFYLQESVQKMIDYQWTKTYSIQKNLFMMYVVMFLIPVSTTLFSESDKVHDLML